jgi:hypothetical protein
LVVSDHFPECSERCCDIVETRLHHAPHKLVVLTLHTSHPTHGNTSTGEIKALLKRHKGMIKKKHWK